MYEIDNKSILMLDWDSICLGIEENLIYPKVAIEYAECVMLQNQEESNSDIVELLILDELEKNCVLALVRKLAKKKNKKTKRVLRCAILSSIANQKLGDGESLDRIIDVYEDFDCPEDMEEFIAYLPTKDADDYNPEEHSIKENQRRMVKKFENFLKEEIEWVNMR
ncbi:MAG: DUF2247 family protein [Clostridia bacterium]